MVEPYSRRELIDFGAVLYPERALPLSQISDADLALFITLEVVHTQDAYTDKAISRLLNERGLHVGHCYLLNRLPYVAGMFERDSSSPRLTETWLRFIDDLEEQVRSGRLWNPTVTELAEWLRAAQRVVCLPSGSRSVRLINQLNQVIQDYTLLVPHSIDPDEVVWASGRPKGWRYWKDWLAVWGDLPAGRSTVIEWGGNQTCAQTALSVAEDRVEAAI
jgi:hypothetical protein